MDLIGECVARIQTYSRNGASEGRGNVIEGVVIVVEHDHDPLTAQSGLGSGGQRAFEGIGVQRLLEGKWNPDRDPVETGHRVSGIS